MSQPQRIKYILTPDFHKRLLTKDISNLKWAVPKNPHADVSKVHLTTETTKILSPFVRFNDAEILQAAFSSRTAFKTYKLAETELKPEVKHEELAFSYGPEFVKWLKNYATKTTAPLKKIPNKDEFIVNVHDKDLKNILDAILEQNDIASLESFLESSTNQRESAVKYLLQHLNEDQHEIFQKLCNYGSSFAFSTLFDSYMSSLLAMSTEASSLNIFEVTFVEGNKQLTEQDVDNLIKLNLKFDRLSRAKSYIDVLLKNGFLPTEVSTYIAALSTKLESDPEKRLKFNLLTQGLDRVFNKHMTAEIAAYVLPYINDKSEYTSLLSFIDQSNDRQQIYESLLNDLISKYHIILAQTTQLSTQAKAASFNLYVMSLKNKFSDFDKIIDKGKLLRMLIEQENYHSAYDLLDKGFVEAGDSETKLADIFEAKKIPEAAKKVLAEFL